MRGRTAKTLENVRAAQLMREDGYTLREIADTLGIAIQTAHTWITDPDGTRMRARKDTYRGECIDCGGPTSGCNGPAQPPERCATCRHEHEKATLTYWTRERILDAIRAWADTHGGVPPAATDWLYANNGAHRPSASWVLKRCGSWSEAIRLAGFEPRAVGKYGRPGEDDALCAEIRERYEAGESSFDLAREYGCTPSTITYRIRKAGGKIRSHAEAWQTRRLREAA